MSIGYHRRFRPSHLYSIIITALVLFMIGLVGLLFIHGKKLSNHFREQLEFTVILKDNLSENQVQQLLESLQRKTYTRSAEYVSKEEALRRFRGDSGEDPMSILDANPLFASINIHLKSDCTVADSIARIKKYLIQNPMVSEFFYEQRLVDLVNDNFRKIGIIALVMALILLVIALTLIDNTVRLAMFANRFLIRSMQLVGATRWFIVRPYAIRGLWHGLFSGLLAVGLLLTTLNVLISQVPQIAVLQDYTLSILLFAVLLGFGMIFSYISTWIAVRKYLRKKLDELY